MQDAYAKLNASFRLFADNDRWEFAVIGRNLTEERTLNNGLDRTGTGGSRGVTGAPSKGTNLPSCASISDTGCAALADIIGTPTRGRSVALQFTFRY